MDLAKMISLIAEVAVKKAIRDRDASSNKTTPEAVLLRLRWAVAIAQSAIRIAARPSDRRPLSFYPNSPLHRAVARLTEALIL